MKLLIDIGNTRLKLARLDASQLRFLAALPTQDKDVLAAGLAEQLAALPPCQEAWGVCVGTTALQRLAQTAIGPATQIQWVASTTHAADIANSYPDPTQLGADRWVAIIGLTRHFTASSLLEISMAKRAENSPSLILATFGTATTVDTLGGDHVFRGGLILPGVAMMRLSLATGTARLPATVGQVADNPISTSSAIASGIVAAQIGALIQQIAVAQRQDGVPPLVCVSGGAYEEIEPALRKAIPGVVPHHLPHVVLDGLAVLANKAV